MGTFKTSVTLYLAELVTMKNISHKICKGNQNMFYVQKPPPPKHRVVYEMPEKPQITIQRMLFACWITKATHTLRICNTYCFSMATTMVTRTRLDDKFIRYTAYLI